MLPGLPWWFRWYAFQPSLVAQVVKNLPAMWETWVQSQGWADPLREGMATHPSILAWRIPMEALHPGYPGSIPRQVVKILLHTLAHCCLVRLILNYRTILRETLILTNGGPVA